MRLRSIISNEEGYAQKFIIRALIVVIVAVAILSEVGPLLWFRFTTISDAEDIATTIAGDYRVNRDPNLAVEIAAYQLKLMNYDDDEIRQCVIELLPLDSDVKTSVRVTVVKYANTLVTRHISQLKKYSRIAATKEVGLPAGSTDI